MKNKLRTRRKKNPRRGIEPVKFIGKKVEPKPYKRPDPGKKYQELNV